MRRLTARWLVPVLVSAATLSVGTDVALGSVASAATATHRAWSTTVIPSHGRGHVPVVPAAQQPHALAGAATAPTYAVPVPVPGRYRVAVTVARARRSSSIGFRAEGRTAVASASLAPRHGSTSTTVTFPATVTDGTLQLQPLAHGTAAVIRKVVVTLLATLTRGSRTPATGSGGTGSGTPAAGTTGGRSPAAEATSWAPAVPTTTSWVSGVWIGQSITSAADLAFGTFRGSAVGLATLYQPRDNWGQIASSSWAIDQYAGWNGQLAIGLPMVPTDNSTTLAQVAAGAHDADFRSFARMLVARGRGNAIIRLGWEFNGNWQPWAAYDPATFIAAFRRIVGDLRSVAPQVQIDWCGNFGPSQVGHDPFTELYPGDDVVDIVGVDAYDTQWTPVRTEADWTAFRTMTGGLDAWRTFAVAHGKRFSVPEWGLQNNGSGDNPFYIQKMHDYFAVYAGQLAYEAYFNEPQGFIQSSLMGPDQNPASASLYAKLWGSQS